MNKINFKLTDEAKEFLINCDPEIRKKFAFAFNKTAEGFTGRWFEKLEGYENLWEFRISHNNNQYRLFACWDKNQKSIIILLNGFLKKDQKTPSKEINKALDLIKNLFN